MTPSQGIVGLDLWAFSPVICVSLLAVVVMLQIGFHRNHRLTYWLTAGGLNVALLLTLYVGYFTTGTDLRLPGGDSLLPRQMTALLMVDHLTVIYWVMALVSSLAVSTLCYAYMQGYADNKEELYLLLVIATAGALVMSGAQHFASFFLGLEILSVPLYGLAAYAFRTRLGLEAGFKYLVLSAAASATMLMGMALIYSQIGSLGFVELAARLTLGHPKIMLAGALLVIAGLAFKLSLVPFHLWTPDVYQGAPAPVTAFLASVSKLGVVAVLLRLYLIGTLYQIPEVRTALVWLAIASMVGGNLLALFQNNVKRLLAYSSIAHFGYLLVALISVDSNTVAAVNFYLLTYLITTLAGFGVITLLSSPYQEHDLDQIEQYRGLFWKRPYLTAILTVTMLSLAGIPLTAGFVGKFYIFVAGMEAKEYGLVGALVFGSAVGLFYYLRLMIALFQAEPGSRRQDGSLAWAQQLGGLVMLGMMGLMLLIGIYPGPFLAWAAGR